MTLDVAEALFLVDRLPGEELPALAVRLLEQGADTPTIRQLAGLNKPTVRDAGPLFERMLSELGRRRMTRAEAALVVGKDLARRVLDGRMTPAEAAAQGAFYCPSFEYHEVLTPFLAHDDEYYVCSPQESDAIDEDVRGYCRSLLERDERGTV